MATDRKKAPKFTTPVGTFIYPRVNGKPDIKFVPEGEWRVKLALPQAQADTLIAKLQPLLDVAVAEAKTENPKVAKAIKVGEFFTLETDDQGEETGNVLFNFKQKASHTSKKTGETFNFNIAVFNKAGEVLPADAKIGSGTQGAVAFEVSNYFVAGTKTAGISFRLKAVQIHELVEWGGGSATSFGFGVEEAASEEAFGNEAEDAGDDF